MGTLRVAFLSALAMEFIAGIGTGLVAMVLGLRLLDGSVPLYTALAVLLVSPEVFLPLRRAGAEFHASTEGQAAAGRILDVLDEPVTAPASAASAPPVPQPPLPLSMTGVTVTFAGRTAPALDRFDLHLEAGEHVALIGPSGAGKSTVLAVLLGFVVPDAGTVAVAGTDLSTLEPAAWRRQVAWVPQRPHLFGGTIADNLRLGDPEADTGQLHRVLAAVGLADLVAALPAGLDTAIGDGGLAVSAGERQRLAIARAALRDAPLVLLDEPVAHLDRTTEGHLREALAPWLEGRTVLVAAHRPELVGRIDRTVVLDGDAAVAGDDRTVGAPA
jgi:ATP-binding cassette subfamily C protein CydD